MNQLDDAIIALASLTGWPPSELLNLTVREFLGYLNAAARFRKSD